MRIVCVVLCCGPMFEESASLINSAFNEFTNYEVLSPYEYTTSLPVENGEKNVVRTYTVKACRYPLREQEKANINISYILPEKMSAPVEKNKIIGEIKIFYSNQLIFSEKIYTMEEIKTIDMTGNFSRILKKWINNNA